MTVNMPKGNAAIERFFSSLKEGRVGGTFKTYLCGEA